MSSLRKLTAVLAALTSSAVLVGLTPTPGAAAGPGTGHQEAQSGTQSGAQSGAQSGDRTSGREAARVDAVPTPRLHWTACGASYQCAAAELPLDYDRPRGRTVRVALLKVPARNPSRRVGSLFLNPGGPGGSGKGIAERAASFLSPEVLDRFDLIGMDPRGTNDSTRVRCYPDEAQQSADTAVLGTFFPVGPVEEAAFRRAAGRLATACSTTGRPLSAAMSTSEVARDLEVLRRAVGDPKLSYLGWSYGTYLGQVYASLFPDRIRAVALDGIIDPVAWQGSAATRDLPISLRLDSATGSSRALTTLLQRCRRAGAPSCPLMPDPEAALARVAAQLRAEPLTATDEDGATYQITYAGFVHDLLLTLYAPEALEDVAYIVALVGQMLDDRTSGPVRRRAATRYSGLQERTAQRRQADSVTTRSDPASSPPTNDFELNAAVACSDSRNPVSSRRWAELGDHADRRAPYFGRLWLWGSAPCARSHWTARDEDAATGGFDRRTSAPVLVVGNYYDPATSYDAAVAVSRRWPNSRLLRSDSWGHTAYGTSACVTSAVDAYLLSGSAPARGTVCVGDLQPYAASSAARR